MDLRTELESYVRGRRDSKLESALLAKLRTIRQPDRFEILRPLFDTGVVNPLLTSSALSGGK